MRPSRDVTPTYTIGGRVYQIPIGKKAVKWDKDVQFLKDKGFKVEEYDVRKLKWKSEGRKSNKDFLDVIGGHS